MKPRRTKNDLRSRAEERLDRRVPKPGAGKSGAEQARLLHELEVHQIELEMQNDELRQARAETESLLSQYSDLYDFAPVGYVTLDREGAIRKANLEAAHLLGVERSRLQGSRLRGFVAGPDRRAFDEFLPRAFASHAVERRELALAREGREPLYVRFEFQAAEDGQTGRVVMLDLTEHRRADEQARLAAAVEKEKLALSDRSRRALLSVAEDQRAAAAALAASEHALRASEQKYRDIVETASEGIWITDVEDRTTFVNPRMAEMLGCTPEELVGESVHDFMDERARVPVERNRERRRLGTKNSYEQRYVRRDDSVLWALVSTAPMRDATGQVVGSLNMLTDITERKRAEDALRDSEERATALIKYAPTGIYEVDLLGRKFISINDAMCQILGYTRDELLAVGPLGVLDEGSRARFADRLRLTLAGEKVDETVDYGVIRKDGSVVDAVLYVTFNPSGDRALVVAHDVTERKRAERRLEKTLAELKRSNEDLEQYAYVASHDLQEPLRMVANYVELLRHRYQGHLDARADKYIQYAVNGAVRMQGLIHDLLTYSRVGRRDMATKPVSLGRVVQQAMDNLAAAISLGDARIESGPLPIVSGDETQLVQLFQNLVDNAIKFRGKAQPVIRITAEGVKKSRSRGVEPDRKKPEGSPLDPLNPGPLKSSFVTISVSDNGIGIDPKHYERIFRLFQRLHTQEEYPGTGIGLAVCKKIVERHGGAIRVEPAAGGGSVFRFTLRRQGKVEAEVEAKPE